MRVLRDELLHRHANVATDLPQQCGGKIAPAMHRHRRYPPVAVAELLVRAPLAHFNEPEAFRRAITSRGLSTGIELIGAC